tara:strand:+ start:137 stop:868 length:732 start_codon:yes stop_codon:yes gene_type:complete
MKTLIVIPARMASKRFPNKPMTLIRGKPMIQRVWEKAISSSVGDVLVACSEVEVQDLIISLGGKTQLTDPNIPSGTDRVYSAIEKKLNLNEYESIINLQGDMPLINSKDIEKVNFPLKQGFDIGTLVTNIKDADEAKDRNITKVKVDWIKKEIIGKAIDFHKDVSFFKEKLLYHHVGIYSFRYETLKKFISLQSSDNEKKRNLEQMRAIDAQMSIGVGYINNTPISIDTKEDLIKIKNYYNEK